MTKKRLIVISDLHCGHKFGLTPPGWWASEETADDRLKKHKAFQRALWDFYASEIEQLKPIDILVVNGDAIEGKGERTGGAELVTSNRNEQVRMAAKAIDLAEAKAVRVAYGTGYHTGRDEDFEELLHEMVACEDIKVSGHLFIDVNGCTFDIKHKVARSTIPHGRLTPLIRAALWNGIWSLSGRQPRARFIVRSHVHYYESWKNARCEGVITPAFQYNTIYGIRECEGIVDIGLVYFDIAADGTCKGHEAVLADFGALKVSAEAL
jgi:3',5'-cyclic AMP phosphodiesterase CpdA